VGADLVGQRLRDLELPSGTLVAMIRRDEEVVIPTGDTVMVIDDRLTVLGRPEGISELRARYLAVTR
jgi:APA family basic amino acid/polyamine antiporter